MKTDRHAQRAKAEKARRLHRKVEWELQMLQVLPNDEFMTNEVFRMVLETNENMKQRFETLFWRKERLRRVVWENA